MRAICDEGLFGKDEGYVNVMDGMHWEFAWAHLLWSTVSARPLPPTQFTSM